MTETALPPGPRNAAWQMIRYMRDPEGSILELGRRYGELFTSPSMMGPFVVASAPELIRAIFGAEPDTFQPFGIEAMTPILGKGSLLLQHGSEHKRARRLLQPPFHGPRMRAYGTAMREVTREHLGRAPRDRVLDIEPVFKQISLDIIIRTVFGAGSGERTERYRKATLDAVTSLSPLLAAFPFLRHEFGGWGPWAKFRRRLSAVHEMLREEIRARRSSEPGEDILSLMIAARDEDGAPMEEQEIIDQLFTMVIAGFETTATALTWAIEDIYRAPAILARLREELSAAGGDVEKIAAAPFLEAACSETLRLHPLVPMVSRRLLRPFELGGYSLPAGIGVAACLLLAQRNAQTYPEPEVYRPERFSGGAKMSPYEYLPFGGGARRCLGAPFAFHEMKIVLGTILLEVELELASTEKTRTEMRQATVGPRGGVRVRLR